MGDAFELLGQWRPESEPSECRTASGRNCTPWVMLTSKTCVPLGLQGTQLGKEVTSPEHFGILVDEPMEYVDGGTVPPVALPFRNVLPAETPEPPVEPRVGLQPILSFSGPL